MKYSFSFWYLKFNWAQSKHQLLRFKIYSDDRQVVLIEHALSKLEQEIRNTKTNNQNSNLIMAQLPNIYLVSLNNMLL